MSDLKERLAALAGRGTPRGFDAVFADASRAATLDLIEGGDDDAPDVPMHEHDVVPMVSLETERERRRRRPFMSMIAAAGLASLLVVGMLAIGAVVGSGGASSPEAAVHKLADAVSHEDILGAADVLAPEEVRSLHDTLNAAMRKAEELKLVQTASAPLSGIDFNVSNLKLSTESLGDGYAKVTVDEGTFTAATQKAKFSALMQKALNNYTDNSTSIDIAKAWQDQDLGAFVVTVRHDGNWYVSATYTVLEYIREYQHLPNADFGSGDRAIAALGADSPDAAVQDAVRALQGNDWTKLMSLVRPDEIPFYDYRDAFNELARRNDAKTSFTVDSLTSTSEMHGDTALVTLHASGKASDGTWSVDGGCWKSSTSVEQGPTCVSGKAEVPMFGAWFGGGTSKDPGPQQITAVKQDGRWFVSPVGTVLDVLNRWIAAMDGRTLYGMIGVPEQIPPDGALTLGQPVQLPDGGRYATYVYTLDGHKGEQVIGALKPVDSSGCCGGSVWLLGPTNNVIENGTMPLFGTTVTLPADGTYKVIIRDFGTGNGRSFEMWDKADAPKEVLNPPDGSSTCSQDGVSGTSCSSFGSSPNPGNYPCVNGQLPDKTTCTTGQLGLSGGSSGSSSAVTVPAPTTSCDAAPNVCTKFNQTSGPLG